MHTSRIRGKGRSRLAVGLLAMVLVAGACSSDDTPTSTGGGQAADQGPTGRQELRVGVAADPWIDSGEGDKKRKPN
jgi:hypothetical protein